MPFPGDQAFESISLWGPFSFKRPHPSQVNQNPIPDSTGATQILDGDRERREKGKRGEEAIS